MNDPFDDVVQAARSARAEGRLAEAEGLYRRAEGQATAAGEPLREAFALRHVSDLARLRGALAEALGAGQRACEIYRTAAQPTPLNLANALRLCALAHADLGQAAAAEPLWREARALYAECGVEAGVAECTARLA